MKFKIRYWYSDLSRITGYRTDEEIDEAQLMQLITEAKVNIMIQHNESSPVVWIDDKRFGQR